MSDRNYDNSQGEQESSNNNDVVVNLMDATRRNRYQAELLTGTRGTDQTKGTNERNDNDGRSYRDTRNVKNTGSTGMPSMGTTLSDFIHRESVAGLDIEDSEYSYNSDDAAIQSSKPTTTAKPYQNTDVNNTRSRRSSSTRYTKSVTADNKQVSTKKHNAVLVSVYELVKKDSNETLTSKQNRFVEKLQLRYDNYIDNGKSLDTFEPMEIFLLSNMHKYTDNDNSKLHQANMQELYNIANQQEEVQQEEVQQDVPHMTDRELIDQLTSSLRSATKKGTKVAINTDAEKARLLTLLQGGTYKNEMINKGVTRTQITSKINQLKKTDQEKAEIATKRQEKNSRNKNAKSELATPSVTLNAEKRQVGVQDRVQTTTTTTTTTKTPATGIPPGLGDFPGMKKGTDNYVPSQTQTIENDDTNQNGGDSFRHPTESNVDKNESKYDNALNKSELNDAKTQLFNEINRTDAHLAVVEAYGGIDKYINDMTPKLKAGIAIEDIIGMSIDEYHTNQMMILMMMQQQGQDVTQSEHLDVPSLLQAIGPDADIDIEELSAAIGDTLVTNQSSSDNRTGNRQNIPNQGGQPLSASTGTNTNGIYPNDGSALNDYNRNGTRHDPYNPFSGSGGGGGGGGGGANNGNNNDNKILNAMARLHRLSPHIANMISDPSTRSLLIKRDTSIPDIYPAIRPNNLNIVQQAIARYNYDSNLLNVYFS